MNISQVKKNLGEKVLYKGKEYLLSGCIIRTNGQTFYYQAEIQDLTAIHSVIICKLDDIVEVSE